MIKASFFFLLITSIFTSPIRMEIDKGEVLFRVQVYTFFLPRVITGKTQKLQGGVWIEEGKKPKLAIKIPVQSLHTGSSGRDKTVYRVLGYPKYPYIEIFFPKKASIEPIINSPQGKRILPLLLRIHGKEKEIPFQVQWKWLSSYQVLIQVQGKTSFQEFSLEKPTFLLGSTEEEISLEGRILFYKTEMLSSREP